MGRPRDGGLERWECDFYPNANNLSDLATGYHEKGYIVLYRKVHLGGTFKGRIQYLLRK